MMHTLMGMRVLVFPALQELEELLGSPLLEETHERAANGLHLIAGDFGDPAIAVHVAAGNLLELQVANDVRVHEDLSELARRDDELGNQVHGVVSVATQLCGRALIWLELAV